MSSDQPPTETPSPAEQLPLLALPDDWDGFSPRRGDAAQTGVTARRAQLIAGVLPDFLRRQRWFAAKGLAFDRVTIDWQAIVAGEPDGLWLQVSVPDAADQRYSLPLALCWDDERDNENDAPGIKIGAADIVARVRQQERRGILYDAFAAPSFCHRLLAVMSGQQRLSATGGRIIGTSTARLAPALALPLPVKLLAAASSNTTLSLGDRLLLKAYRRLRPGINVEQEIGRFLGDVSPYRHCAPLAGAIDYANDSGTVTPLALAQQYVANQGDAWSRTLAYLSHFIAESERSDAAPDRSHCAQLRLLTRIGQRTGELHRALAVATDDPDFDPQPIGDGELRAWSRSADEEATATLALLQARLAGLPPEQQAPARALLAARPAAALAAAIAAVSSANGMTMTRCHGDFHLGQVLIAGDDVVLIDFEGEPGRTLVQRRAKQSPWRDVAGLLRSLSYARYSALRQAPSADPATVTRREDWLKDWETRARQAFLAGYRAALPEADGEDRRAADNLLTFLLLEKALYELRYELDHRPSWLAVPLAGLLELLGAAPGRAASEVASRANSV